MSRVIGDFTIMDISALRFNLQLALDQASDGAKADFEKTTATWQRDVDFEIIKDGEYSRVIGTDSEIYGYVNDGTKPHVIRPKQAKALVFSVGGSAKTKVKTIGSTSGSKGNTVVAAKVVHHPGTDARQFDEIIQDKWQKRLERDIDDILR